MQEEESIDREFLYQTKFHQYSSRISELKKADNCGVLQEFWSEKQPSSPNNLTCIIYKYLNDTDFSHLAPLLIGLVLGKDYYIDGQTTGGGKQCLIMLHKLTQSL